MSDGASSLGRKTIRPLDSVGGKAVLSVAHHGLSRRFILQARCCMTLAIGTKCGVLVHWPTATSAAPATVREARFTTVIGENQCLMDLHRNPIHHAIKLFGSFASLVVVLRCCTEDAPRTPVFSVGRMARGIDYSSLIHELRIFE
jgi:hypothetical protein